MNGDFVFNPETEVREYPSDVEVANAILAGKPATVYHLVHSLEDISSIQQEGFNGLIAKPGVFTPLSHKYELKLFGSEYGKKIISMSQTGV